MAEIMAFAIQPASPERRAKRKTIKRQRVCSGCTDTSTLCLLPELSVAELVATMTALSISIRSFEDGAAAADSRRRLLRRPLAAEDLLRKPLRLVRDVFLAHLCHLFSAR